ncbi:MAG TPA: hypothetical protein VGP63_07265 [Planctomycetaceae bacterium]|nr:hypothetical protein [Planctomycetaceae bacterium]
MTSNRVVALLSLAGSGLAVTYVHSPSFRYLVSPGSLRELDVRLNLGQMRGGGP